MPLPLTDYIFGSASWAQSSYKYLRVSDHCVILNLQQCQPETERGHIENSSTVIGLTRSIPGIACETVTIY